MKQIIFTLTISFLSLIACTKEERNEKKIAGVWKLNRSEIKYFTNGEESQSIDSSYQNAYLQLQNTDDVSNMAYFENFSILPSDVCNWDINHGKLKVINFYVIGESDLSMFSTKLNIGKCTRKKLELVWYQSSDTAQIQTKTTLFFER